MTKLETTSVLQGIGILLAVIGVFMNSWKISVFGLIILHF